MLHRNKTRAAGLRIPAALLIIASLLAPTALPAAGPGAGGQGYRIVRQALPQLYDATRAAVRSASRTRKIFADWTEADVGYFRDKLGRLFVDSGTDTPQELVTRFNDRFVGVVGEIYAYIEFRRGTHPPGEVFLPETEYQNYNPEGSRIDGLGYRIIRGKGKPKLVVTAIIESKFHAGGSSPDWRQLKSWIHERGSAGISTPDGDFGPDEVVFEAGRGDKMTLLPFRELNRNRLTRAGLLRIQVTGASQSDHFTRLTPPDSVTPEIFGQRILPKLVARLSKLTVKERARLLAEFNPFAAAECVESGIRGAVRR